MFVLVEVSLLLLAVVALLLIVNFSCPSPFSELDRDDEEELSDLELLEFLLLEVLLLDVFDFSSSAISDS